MGDTAKIKSTTKGATIKKQGHTSSGKHGTSINKKANSNPRVIDPKG
jgi:hypothetical protein